MVAITGATDCDIKIITIILNNAYAGTTDSFTNLRVLTDRGILAQSNIIMTGRGHSNNTLTVIVSIP
jgi:hypothetical protein